MDLHMPCNEREEIYRKAEIAAQMAEKRHWWGMCNENRHRKRLRALTDRFYGTTLLAPAIGTLAPSRG